jgi:hypothetical protein
MARGRHDRLLVVIGTILVVAYVVQASLHLEWPWLVNLQTHDSYKLATGILLAIYLGVQWRGVRRTDRERSVFRHRLGGAIAPLVLYIHSSRFAYGYLILLCAMYLGTAIAGLLHEPVLLLRTRWLYTLWFVVHVALATALLVLAAYHVVVALQYE